jgi:GNAT superfamily N-acetyltransferase
MMEVTVIPSNETDEWIAESQKVKSSLKTAYQACIKTILPELTFDPRFIKNDHLVNVGFDKNPIFVCGMHKVKHHITIAVLYVFPEYRNKGVANYFVKAFQSQTNRVIQLAVEDSQVSSLHGFYAKLGFKTLGVVSKDCLGIGYVDYFWSYKPIKLEKIGKNIMCSYLNDAE